MSKPLEYLFVVVSFYFHYIHGTYTATTIITECANDLHSIMWKNTNDFKWRKKHTHSILTMCEVKKRMKTKKNTMKKDATFLSRLSMYCWYFYLISLQQQKKIVFIRNEKKNCRSQALKIISTVNKSNKSNNSNG